MDERPAAMKFMTEEKDRQFATFDAVTHEHFGPLAVEARTAIILGGIDARVPNDDLAAAVFALGDDAFERGVIERMVLGHHGQASFAVRERRSVRNRP